MTYEMKKYSTERERIFAEYDFSSQRIDRLQIFAENLRGNSVKKSDLLYLTENHHLDYLARDDAIIATINSNKVYIKEENMNDQAKLFSSATKATQIFRAKLAESWEERNNFMENKLDF